MHAYIVISACLLFGSGELKTMVETEGWQKKKDWQCCCEASNLLPGSKAGTGRVGTYAALNPLWDRAWMEGGSQRVVGKEVRWLQAEQVLLKPLAIHGRNCCFDSRTCDTLAGQKDAQQSCQMNEACVLLYY